MAIRPVILDTNALLMVFQFKVNITTELQRLLGEFKVYVPLVVINELESLERSVPEAKMAIALAHRYDIYDVKGTGDTAILNAAKELEAVVVTNDKELRTRLARYGLSSIYMKQGRYLEFEKFIKK